MRINQWVRTVHDYAVDKGWWSDAHKESQTLLISSKLALVHSEVSEALEELRAKGITNDLLRLNYEHSGPYGVFVDELATDPDGRLGKPIGFASELADVVIRVFDLAGYLGIDLEKAIQEKHNYNLTRAHRHGGKAI